MTWSDRVKALLVLTGMLVTGDATFTRSLHAQSAVASSATQPLVFGETFTMASRALGETRRINVWLPPTWAVPADGRLPVLYMPDGGMQEDFPHVAGLLHVLIGNGGMRPFLLVGIENTQRRRDLTGPTTVESDRAIGPVVGGSAAFRAFLRDELKPLIAMRYAVTSESGIIGESLAGLFVLETLVLEPSLFDHYLAFDPSLWWNAEGLTSRAVDHFRAMRGARKQLAVVLSSEPSIVAPAERFRSALAGVDTAVLSWRMSTMPAETHATIYHPAALATLRAFLGPPGEKGKGGN